MHANTYKQPHILLWAASVVAFSCDACFPNNTYAHETPDSWS